MRKGGHPIAAAVALAMVICLGSAGVSLAVAQSRAADESTASSEVAMLEQQVADERARVESEADDALGKATGVDMARVANDSATIESVMDSVTTWDDFESYKASRQVAIDAGIPEDSQFLTKFMPAPKEYTGTDGDARNTIDDANATTRFSSASTYVRGVDGDVYQYACVVTATSTVGDASVDTRYVVTCSTDADGNITDAWAIQLGE